MHEDCVNIIENDNDAEEATTRNITTDGGNECDSNDNSKENENTEVEAVKAVEKNDNYNNEDAAENAAEDENDRNAEKTMEIHVQEKKLEVENDDDETTPVSQHVNNIPDVIPVHCIATVENCPDSTLNEDYEESIRRFLVSEQHLSRILSQQS